VYVHHYTQYMEAACFDEAADAVDDLIAEYDAVDNATAPATEPSRMRPIGV
jgi:hypothetical protein